MKTLLAALIATLVPLLAAAQAAAPPAPPVIWRCGADGRSYSDSPCAEGRARGTVDVIAAARPQADVDDAFARARRERLLAERLRSERLAAEAADAAALRKAHAAALKASAKAVRPAVAAPAAASQRHPRRHGRQQTADDGIFRAVAPASRPTKG